MSSLPPGPSTDPVISYETLIHTASSAIIALKHAGYRFTTTINQERNPVPGNPAYHVFIALHDDDANGFVPHTMIDIRDHGRRSPAAGRRPRQAPRPLSATPRKGRKPPPPPRAACPPPRLLPHAHPASDRSSESRKASS